MWARTYARSSSTALRLPDEEFVRNGLSRFVRASDVAGIIGDGGHSRPMAKAFMAEHRRAAERSARTIGVSSETLGMSWQLALRTMQAIETEFQGAVRLTFWFES